MAGVYSAQHQEGVRGGHGGGCRCGADDVERKVEGDRGQGQGGGARIGQEGCQGLWCRGELRWKGTFWNRPNAMGNVAVAADALHATNHHSLGVVRSSQNAAEGSSDVVQDEMRIVENVIILAAGRRDAVQETKPRDSGSWLRAWKLTAPW